MNVNKICSDYLFSTGLFLLSGIAVFIVSPWSKLFPMLYLWPRIALPIFLFTGCFGQILKRKKMLSAGVIGCWLFIWLIAGSIIPDEEYIYFYDQDLPPKDFMIIRLIGLTFLALLLLGGFRRAQQKQKQES